MNKLREILMKMIYNSKKEIIENHLSLSNIGARRKKSTKDHLFVINGIINERIKRRSTEGIDIVFYNICQAFDSLWAERTLLDVFKNGVNDNMLNLLHEGTKSVDIRVKTPMGETEVKTIQDIILQGESFSSLLCTSSVDLMSQESTGPVFKYRRKLEIPKLSFVDDLADIQICGKDTILMNRYTVEEVEKRRLQFAAHKCKRMHVGKQNNECPDIQINEWKIEEDKDENTTEKEDEYCVGEIPIKSVKKQEYLGSILAHDGKNEENIKSRVSKGQGIVNDILAILNNVHFGDFYIDAFILLRQSLLLSVLLYDIEIVYNLSLKDIMKLESIDYQLSRRVLAVSSKSSKAILMLELSLCPIRFHIMKKRLLYCHFLLTTDSDNLAKSVLLQQISDPIRGDFAYALQNDLVTLNLAHLTFEKIKGFSKIEFKRIVTKQMEEAAFKYLLSEKNKLKKSQRLIYTNFSRQDYLKSGSNLSKTAVQNIYCVRSESLEVASNYSTKYKDNLLCPHISCPGEDSQQHLYSECEYFKISEKSDNNTLYEEIFGCNTGKLSFISKRIFKAYKQRNDYLSFQQTRRDPEEP